MSKRITIIMEDEIDKKLRLKQAKLIQNSMSAVSYSSVINQTLKKGLE